ncbi:MAG: ribonuclease HII, partial [Candidatus Competibacterales bacterium]
ALGLRGLGEVVVEGKRLTGGFPYPGRGVVGGDSQIPAVSAASIVAKTHRDGLMVALDARYPGYGFAAHKGYGTRQHLEALAALGPCPEHRQSFAPVRRAVGRGG